MANQRDGYYKREARRVRQDGAGWQIWGICCSVFDVVMIVITILAALALLGGLLAKVIDPRSTVLFVFAGLFYPIIYLVNLCCGLWWAVRWNKMFFVSAAVLLIGAGSMGLFYRSDISTKKPTVDKDRGDVVVATYNVMTFSAMSDKDMRAEQDCVAGWINDQGAHIVCLQESYFSAQSNFDDFKDKLSKLSYGFFVNSTPSRAESQKGSGFAILSAYPIVRRGISDADENSINAVWADVKIGRDTVRVFNTHLQSTGITSEESHTTLTTDIIDDDKGGDKLIGIARKMARNYRVRAGEASHISHQITGSKYPVVVCGDFNDTPMSYAYKHMKTRRLNDAFVKCGKGVEYTYKGLYNLFRIDYIFSDKEFFDVKSYDSYTLDVSDHKAIVVRLGRES